MVRCTAILYIYERSHMASLVPSPTSAKMAAARERWVWRSLVPSPPLPLTKWPRKGWSGIFGPNPWFSPSQIPNNSGQSHRCMVTCLQKSRAKLVGDESRAPFSSMFLSTGYSAAILMFIYTRGDVFRKSNEASAEML